MVAEETEVKKGVGGEGRGRGKEIIATEEEQNNNYCGPLLN